MLARIVENWLTSASERTFEAPFTQLLIAEGLRVLHAPVHHPIEHGKDLIATSPDGRLCAYQLKGGDLGLSDLERIQGQLFALSTTAISYPGIEPPRIPDSVYLVTNGNLTPPARDRLRAVNDANRTTGRPVISLIEKEQLLHRFVAAHDQFAPASPTELRALLTLVIARGESPFLIADFAKVVDSIAVYDAEASDDTVRRSLSSSLILTAYATTAWVQAGNHLAEAQAWLVTAVTALRAGAANHHPDSWRSSYLIARDSARRALLQLVDEARSKDDLVIPDMVEGLVYGTRATLVLAYASALLIAEQQLEETPIDASAIRQLLLRELPHVRAAGECSAGALFMIATALETLGEQTEAATTMVKWAAALIKLNQPESEEAVPDPYHDEEEIMLSTLDSGNSYRAIEQFAGQAYTLHTTLDWLARRNLREVVGALWPKTTKIHFAEFVPSPPSEILAQSTENGELKTWAPATPQSWGILVDQASRVSEEDLPDVLWREPFVLPFLPLIYPHRHISVVAKAIDYVATGRCAVQLTDED